MAVGQMSSTGKQSGAGGSDKLYRIIIRETSSPKITMIFYSKTKIENVQQLHDYLLDVVSVYVAGFKGYGNTFYPIVKIEYNNQTSFYMYRQGAGSDTIESESYASVDNLICEEVY